MLYPSRAWSALKLKKTSPLFRVNCSLRERCHHKQYDHWAASPTLSVKSVRMNCETETVCTSLCAVRVTHGRPQLFFFYFQTGVHVSVNRCLCLCPCSDPVFIYVNQTTLKKGGWATWGVSQSQRCPGTDANMPLRLMSILIQREMMYFSFGTSPSQPVYSKTSSHTKALSESLRTLTVTFRSFSTFPDFLSHKFSYLVSPVLFRRLVLNIKPHFYQRYSSICISHLPLISPPFTTSKCFQTTASRRAPKQFLACFREWLFPFFSLSLQFFLLPSKHIPANTSTEKEKKKKGNLAFSRQRLSKKPPLAHGSRLHSFPNANQMWSNNVWQHFFFFLFQRKTNVGQKCSLSAVHTQWCKNKFRFIPEVQTSPHGG